MHRRLGRCEKLVGGEYTDPGLSDVEVDELVRLVRHETPEISTDEAMPSTAPH